MRRGSVTLGDLAGKITMLEVPAHAARAAAGCRSTG